MTKPKYRTVRASLVKPPDPFAEGANARMMGREKRCPYRLKKRAAWLAGWTTAEREGAGD